MHCLWGCGRRQLRKHKKLRLYWCPHCSPRLGPVGPRPAVEAARWGIPLELRNAIHLRQLDEGDRDPVKIEAIRVEMILAYRERQRVETADA